MFWIKATTMFITARRRPDDMACEVETELRFHIAMRTRDNIEQGMKPHDAQRAALQSFGNFERVKSSCCEIRRSLPFDTTPLTIGLHISIAGLAGFAALWAVNAPHHNLMGLLEQLVAIAVLTVLFTFARRARSTRVASEFPTSDMADAPSAKITAYDEDGCAPVERVFKS